MNTEAKNKKNNNMKKEELIGKKVRGFRFAKQAFSKVEYMSTKMDKYVGKVGVIEEFIYYFNRFRVKFEDGMSYHYPAELIEQHLVDEEPAIEIKEGDYIRGFETTPRSLEFANKYVGVIGRVVSLYESSIAVEFSGGTIVHYPKDQAITHLCNDDMKEFEKSLDQSAEEFINDANINIIDKVMNEEVIEMFEKAQKDLIKQGYTCPQTKQQCDDECCVSVENCHLKTSVDLEEVKIKANKGADISFDCKSSNDLKLQSLNESCIDYGKIEHDPLDDLPIIGDGVLMEVSDDEEKWFERKICGNTKLGFFIAWIEDEGKTFYAWKYARPITPKTKITRKEFESKFEIID